MSENEKLRKMESLESKRVTELSNETVLLRSQNSKLKTELNNAEKKIENLEIQLVESATLKQKVNDIDSRTSRNGSADLLSGS